MMETHGDFSWFLMKTLDSVSEDEIHESVGSSLRLQRPQCIGSSLYAHLHVALAMHHNCHLCVPAPLWFWWLLFGVS